MISQLPKQYQYLQADIDELNELLHKLFLATDQTVQTPIINLLHAGGKRIRPLLCIICSRCSPNRSNEVLIIAAVLEMIHMASIIHDDVIDHAVLRRGEPTVHYTYNPQIAIQVGDYLFSYALEIATQLEDKTIHRRLATTLTWLVKGELAQLNTRYQIDQSVKNYFMKIRNKTARLIATCCEVGAKLNQAPPSLQNQLANFGYYLGMSYQIKDDLLDFSDYHQTGKDSKTDLLEGYLTLPTLLALSDKTIYNQVHKLFNQGSSRAGSDDREIIHLIKQSGAIEQANQVSHWYLMRALKVGRSLPDFPEKPLLLQMAAGLAKRTH
ncbi:heptaprenyl diphosphate synthase [Amphibacillus marinus]|uniref:Heptaprenyl diphosphate synthase n=1 Tax=Amphibacillus marinus TaxID=872970 RepID=A0A1H8GG84_9BACI|nr:polyprenyl synthetase family protein [Amphibacillus marinus]SEN42754.1 heptaprenyl diphosphate synthase [Amphibacillus marinus]